MTTPCTRQEALEHLKEHVHTDSLMKHSLAVEASMRHFARYYGGILGDGGPPPRH